MKHLKGLVAAVFQDLALSKKFRVALFTVLLQGLGLLGLELELETVLALSSPLLTYIVSQGIADAKAPRKRRLAGRKRRAAGKV